MRTAKVGKMTADMKQGVWQGCPLHPFYSTIIQTNLFAVGCILSMRLISLPCHFPTTR